MPSTSLPAAAPGLPAAYRSCQRQLGAGIHSRYSGLNARFLAIDTAHADLDAAGRRGAAPRWSADLDLAPTQRITLPLSGLQLVAAMPGCFLFGGRAHG